MSKEEKEAMKNLQPEVAETVSLTVSRGVQGLITFTKTKAGLQKVLADDHARSLLTRTMHMFVSVDQNFETGMKAMGEILYNFIHKQGEDMKRKVLKALCEAQGVAPVELDPKHPRLSFAAALFARFPDMHKQIKGGKDTYAAQRVSAYIQAYLDSKPGSEGRKKSSTKSDKLRTAADLFMKLYASGTAPEQETLIRMAKRAGIEYEGWLPEPVAVKKG